jgi:monofunctional glycosyltransferase
LTLHRRPRSRLLWWTLVALGLLAVGVGAVWSGLPARSEVRALSRSNPKETALMRQRTEDARRAGRRTRRSRQWVPLGAIPRDLIWAVVLCEDAKFFDHEGLDWQQIQESAEKNLRRFRFARGGSTITQQLAKNLFFSTRKDPLRKLRELVVARWMEEDLRKTRILELYLNLIEWGDGVYGCAAAAGAYYGKPVAELTRSEAAGLAAMIPSPLTLNPRTSPTRHRRAQARVERLLDTDRYVVERVKRLGIEGIGGRSRADPDA